MNLAEDIKQKALDLGFDLVGITDASPVNNEQVELLADWLKSGYAGRMNYMHNNFEKRINPAKLLEDAQSIIVVGLNYKPPPYVRSLRARRSRARQSHHDKLEIASSTFGGLAMTLPTAPAGKVTNYAQYQDYHSFIKKRLRRLANFIGSLVGRDLKFKICVDSAPVAERALAMRAGLGFIGKNRMLINPQLGPQIFLGEIITTLKLQADEPITDNCSNCNKCIEACPTGALRPDGRFDANKCISYLTIEYKDQIPAELAEKIGDRLFGCDECVLACPYQEDAPVCTNKQFKFYNDRAKLDLRRILNLSRQDFDAEFADSPINRLGLDRLKRNARICLSNITR